MPTSFVLIYVIDEGMKARKRSVPSGKTYNRNKDKQKIGREFRDGFDADFVVMCVGGTLILSLDEKVTQ